MSTMTTQPVVSPPRPPRRPVPLTKQMIFWACAFFILALLLWLLNDVLLPFIAGMVLAYLLDPAVRRLQKWGLNRTLASVLIVFAMIILVVVGLILLVPAMMSQIGSFTQHLPQYIERLQELAISKARAGSVSSSVRSCRTPRSR